MAWQVWPRPAIPHQTRCTAAVLPERLVWTLTQVFFNRTVNRSRFERWRRWPPISIPHLPRPIANAISNGRRRTNVFHRRPSLTGRWPISQNGELGREGTSMRWRGNRLPAPRGALLCPHLAHRTLRTARQQRRARSDHQCLTLSRRIQAAYLAHSGRNLILTVLKNTHQDHLSFIKAATYLTRPHPVMQEAHRVLVKQEFRRSSMRR